LEDDAAPIGFVGVAVFLFSEQMRFHDELAETREGIEHFGLEMALEASAEEHGAGVAEVAGGLEIGGEKAADLGAGLEGVEALQFALFMEIAKAELGLGVKHVAVAAIVWHVVTQLLSQKTVKEEESEKVEECKSANEFELLLLRITGGCDSYTVQSRCRLLASSPRTEKHCRDGGRSER
jgi:hypothetical protein